MKFKIPKIKTRSEKTPEPTEDSSSDNADEIFEELEHVQQTDYTEQQPAPKAPSFSISEAQLSKVWAGEIAFGILASVAAVIAAFIG